MEGITKIVKIFDATDHATYDALEYRCRTDSGEEITQLFSLQNEEPETIIAELERGEESDILRDAEYEPHGIKTPEDYADARELLREAENVNAEYFEEDPPEGIDYIVRIYS